MSSRTDLVRGEGGRDAVLTPPGDREVLSRDSSAGYRPALDGIRAVAVLAVIAYHLGYRWIPGGFIGVDVFFVLSGYLITSLLLAEHARRGRIDLRAFWFRRARRLLPALLVMVAVVAVWIYLTASPYEMETRRADLLWTVFYASNWHFIASGQDYFAQFMSASPVRHTWSLAIEEQFYLAWPLLVAGALWVGRRRPGAVAVLSIVGIVLSVAAMALLYTPGDPSRAYYGTDARIHQLLVGSLLAVFIRRSSALRIGTRVTGAVAVAAVILLLAAFGLVHDTGAAYYRGASLAVALVTAALVWAIEMDPRGLVARLLSLRPVAWVGQISYGLYLWHWPVILAVMTIGGPLAELHGSTGLNLVRLAITFALTVVSFYLLEQPIRRGRMPGIGRSARRFAVATTAAILLVSSVAVVSTRADLPNLDDCADYAICVRQVGPEGAPVLAVFGDSIARSLDPAFIAIARQRGWTYVLGATHACRVTHLLSAASVGGDVARLVECAQRTPDLQERLIAEWNPSIIVVVDANDIADIDQDGRRIKTSTPEHLRVTEQALTAVASEFAATGAGVGILKLPPPISKDCMQADRQLARSCRKPLTGYTMRTRYAELYDGVAASLDGVESMSITDVVCPGGFCAPLVNGQVVRWDGTHFTGPGALLVAPSLGAQLEAILAARP
jgi:peptidoglycan/LPS O-acetylase OafA/YrhL/lysophospholipase L1-like esterase